MNPNVEAARIEVASLGVVTDKTVAHYASLVRRLMNGRAAPRAKRTARQYRAAWIWHQKSSLANLLVTWDATPSPECLARIVDHLEALRRIRASILVSGRGTASKRRGMESLPPDWQFKLIEAAQNSELRALLSLLALTGIRPAELEKGVIVESTSGTLKITISGAKVDTYRGHESRTLTLPPKSSLSEIISCFLEERKVNTLTISADAAKFRRVLIGMSRKVFPSLSYQISQYTFRHALASACKRGKIDATEIARVLGHRCTKSQSCYGRSLLGQAGHFEMVRAVTSRPIRDNARDPRDLPVVSHDVPMTGM